MPTKIKSLEERFWTKVDFSGDCWEWLASKRNGYGQIGVPGSKTPPAHRVSYELLIGPIPEGLELDHLCRNRGCVNPEHLEPVTTKVNLLRGESLPAQNARKTHCVAGHLLDEENIYHSPKNPTWRWCRECRRRRDREYRERQRDS